MAISGDYPSPVTVNGFSCKNCTDVDYAKKHIDPQRPKDGPYGIDAKVNDKRVGGQDHKTVDQARDPTPTVVFGGSLAQLGQPASTSSPARPAQGRHLNIAV